MIESSSNHWTGAVSPICPCVLVIGVVLLSGGCTDISPPSSTDAFSLPHVAVPSPDATHAQCERASLNDYGVSLYDPDGKLLWGRESGEEFVPAPLPPDSTTVVVTTFDPPDYAGNLHRLTISYSSPGCAGIGVIDVMVVVPYDGGSKNCAHYGIVCGWTGDPGLSLGLLTEGGPYGDELVCGCVVSQLLASPNFPRERGYPSSLNVWFGLSSAAEGVRPIELFVLGDHPDGSSYRHRLLYAQLSTEREAERDRGE
jgi:hypothetical protein